MAQGKRNVLVIGGSRGIGAAVVRRFTGQGDAVAFTYAGSTEAASALAQEVRGGLGNLDIEMSGFSA